MSVLRYCCFRWLVYDRALVFEPSRPLACIILLVWLIYVLELCCDIFPWVLDLDRTHLRVWLVYDWIEGVTSKHLGVGIYALIRWSNHMVLYRKWVGFFFNRGSWERRVKWWLLRLSNLQLERRGFCDLTAHWALLRRFDRGSLPSLYYGVI